jgi:hypothetical protein
VSPEDFLLQKVKVGRGQDFEDGVAVVGRFGNRLDRRYLEAWARSLGVEAKLEFVFDSARTRARQLKTQDRKVSAQPSGIAG